jgi:hypothetical protein
MRQENRGLEYVMKKEEELRAAKKQMEEIALQTLSDDV